MNLNLIRDLTLRFKTQGSAEATAALKAVAGAQKGVTDTAAGMSTTTERAAKGQVSLADAVSKAERRFNTALRAQQDYEKLQRQLNRAVERHPELQSRANAVLAQARAHFDSAAGSTSKFAQAAKVAGDSMQGLSAPLGVVGQMMRTLGPAGVAMAVGLGAAALGFAAAAKGALALADTAGRLRDLADTTDFTVEQLQALNDVAAQVGVSSNSMTTAIERFSAGMVQTSQGTSDLYKKLQQVDQPLADQVATATNLAEAWDAVSQAVTQVSKNEANAIGRSAFGRGGVEIVRVMRELAQGGGIQGALNNMNKLDVITTQQAEKWDDLGDSIARNMRLAKQNIQSAFGDFTLQLLDKVSELILKAARAMKEFANSSHGVKFGQFMRGEEVTGVPATPPTASVTVNKQNERDKVIKYYEDLRVKMEMLGPAMKPQEKLTLETARLNAEVAKGGEFLKAYADRAIEAFRNDQTTQQLQKRVQTLGTEAKTIDVVKSKQNEINQANREGAGITDEQTAAILRKTQALHEMSQLEDQLGFERGQIGRDQVEQQVATRLRAEGMRYEEHMEGATAQMIRQNLILERNKQILEDAFGGFISDLAKGVDLMTALSNMAGKLGQTLISIGTNQVISGLFSAPSGGAQQGGQAGGSLMGGGLGSIMGGLGLTGMAGGAATLGLGIGLTMLSGFMQKREQAKQEAAQAQATWKAMHEDFSGFLDKMAGSIRGPFATAVEGARREMQQFTDAAAKAKDFGAVAQAQQAFNLFREDQARRFFSSAQILQQAYTRGDQALVDATVNVHSFTDAVRGFVGDTKYFGQLFLDAGEAAVALGQAQEAARQFALTALSIPPVLDETVQKANELRGKAAALIPIMHELGMSTEEAADAVKNSLIAGLNQLKATVEDTLMDEINVQQGFGWLNDINDILARFNALGSSGVVDQGLLMTWLKGSLQEVVDQAELTGAAFDRLVGGMPQLIGLIHEFSGAVTMTASEIADQLRTLQDRLFAATTDTSTRAGALAAFDRNVAQERLTIAAENMALFEQVVFAERLNIIKEFNRQAVEADKRASDERKRVMEEAQNFIEGIRRRITEWLANLRAGSQSPLSPAARLSSAQTSFNEQLALAQGGDRAALNGITQFAQTLLDAGRAMFGSGSGFQTLFNTVTAQVEALPDQVDMADLIVEAINNSTTSIVNATDTMSQDLAAALAANNSAAVAAVLTQYLPLIDTNTNNSISFAEMQQAFQGTYTSGTLRSIFNELDGNSNGILEKMELVKTATQGTATSAATTVTNTGSTATSNAALATEVSAQGITLDALAQISSSASATVTNTNNLPGIHTAVLNIQAHELAIRQMMQSANATRKVTNPFVNDPAAVFHSGGLAGDEMMAVLQRNEYVVNRASTAANLPLLQAINSSQGRPINVAGFGGMGEVVSELQQLRAENRELMKQLAAIVAGTQARTGAAMVGQLAALNSTAERTEKREMRKREQRSIRK